MQEVRKFDRRRYSIAICALLVSLSGTAYGDDGVSTPENTPEVTPEREKGYILTPVEEEGEYTITKIELNTDTGKFEPKYYRVDLAKTEYGSGSENTLYYNWEKDSDGNYTLQEGASATGDNSIIYNYDSSDSLSRKENPTSDVVGNFIKNNISSTSSPAYGGAIYNDGTIGNIAGNFIGNYASSSYPISTSSSSYSASGGAIFNSGSIVMIMVVQLLISQVILSVIMPYLSVIISQEVVQFIIMRYWEVLLAILSVIMLYLPILLLPMAERFIIIIMVQSAISPAILSVIMLPVLLPQAERFIIVIMVQSAISQVILLVITLKLPSMMHTAERFIMMLKSAKKIAKVIGAGYMAVLSIITRRPRVRPI